MSQAIITKYIGATATKQARVKATCEAASITIPWDSFYTTEQNHLDAVYELQKKIGTSKVRYHYGWLGNQMVAVRGD